MAILGFAQATALVGLAASESAAATADSERAKVPMAVELVATAWLPAAVVVVVVVQAARVWG